ncbi:hypothetical protein V2W45_1325806 [Cenococcum geophilum]
MSSTLKSCATYKAYLKMERLPKGVDAFVMYNVSPNLENPVLCRKKVRDYSALRNYIKKYGIRTKNVGKGGAPFIKNLLFFTLLKELDAKVLYTKCLNITSNSPTKTSKKGLKKSGLKRLKAIKRKAAKPTGITEEDIIVAMFL